MAQADPVQVLQAEAATDPQPAPFAQYTSLVGRTITSPSGGRYRLALRRVLGVGAYGVVYLAEEIERNEPQYTWHNPTVPAPDAPARRRHERTREATISTAGRMYAVKVMRCSPRGSRQRAFQAREVALHRKADGHPGVVPLYAVYGTGSPPTWSPRKRKAWSSASAIVRREDELTWDRDAELSGPPLPVLQDGLPEELVYMVLAYVGGGDLFTLIAERQRYIGDDALVKSVFVQLLDAVQWCHDRGVCHRDLKPENVLCEQDGRTVLISDFGLATMDEWSRDYGCGSSYYMSPECFGEPLAPATCPSYNTLANDVWTLGIVLVNLTTGRNPWEAASPLDPTFESYCRDPAEFLMSILPITPEANAVLTRVFELNQTRRCSVSELRGMVLGVERWTLRGRELDGAGEGAREVARGCGLLDPDAPEVEVEVELDAGRTRAGSGGSAVLAERSRFSEDTIISSSSFDDDYSDEEGEDYSVVQSSGFGGRGRSESILSSASASASSEMSRSRPVSRILSNSPTLVGPAWGAAAADVSDDGPDQDQAVPESESEPGANLVSPARESVPRWPKLVHGWNSDESEEPRTRRVETTPRAPVGTTPRARAQESNVLTVSPDGSLLRTPRSTPSLRSNPTLAPTAGGDGLLGSPFRSMIPRYTWSPRARTVSFDPPSRLAPKDDSGRERMKSAPSPGHAAHVRPKGSFTSWTSRPSTRQLDSKASLSTLSAASSESSGFPITPLKAQVVLASPRLIVSHPSDESTMWTVPRSSGSSVWDASSSSHATLSSTDVDSETAVRHCPLTIQPGAPLYDATARLVDPRLVCRPRTVGLSSPCMSIDEPESPTVRWNSGVESVGSTPKRKVKRVPVPPIPSELLEEHERQMNLKRTGGPTQYDLAVDSPTAVVRPPPGLALDDRPGECRAGPKRLLENARAWFRRI